MVQSEQTTDLNIVDTDFSIVLLCLQFQLDVQEGDLRFLVTFRLHLKASIGEGLFKGHTSHQLRFLQNQTVGLITKTIQLDLYSCGICTYILEPV